MTDRLARCGFYLPHRPDLVGGEAAAPAVGASVESSLDAWITQTYQRLRAAGRPVVACDATSLAGLDVVVVHPSHVLEVAARSTRPRVLAVTVADKTYGHRLADVVIAQNGLGALPRSTWIPHWPQPDLLPRDSGRTEVRTAAFKGRRETLHPGFLAPSWGADLDGLGIQWSIDDASSPEAGPHPWSDYRSTDVIVAVRPPDRNQAKSKPASKLVNAWLAGVPAVLGVEPQYRELRTDELDYLEADAPAAAFAALRRLREEPDHYRRMVDRGRERAGQFDEAAVLRRWIETLERRTGPSELRVAVGRPVRRGLAWAMDRRRPGVPLASAVGGLRR